MALWPGSATCPTSLSMAVMRTAASSPAWREMSELAAGGFDTATRLAAHDPGMFSDILRTNRDNVARYLDLLIQQLSGFRSELERDDPEIVRELEEAHRLRIAWEETRRQARAGG